MWTATEKKHDKPGYEGPSHFMIRHQGPSVQYQGLYLKVNGCGSTEANRIAANGLVALMNDKAFGK